MTASDFTMWRDHLHINRQEAAILLGLCKNSVTAYERGRVRIPQYVALACSALAMRLEPWPG